MADLDDFFAKKDKKKGKSKKFISSDELVRQLEQPVVTKEETKIENSENTEAILEVCDPVCYRKVNFDKLVLNHF